MRLIFEVGKLGDLIGTLTSGHLKKRSKSESIHLKSKFCVSKVIFTDDSGENPGKSR